MNADSQASTRNSGGGAQQSNWTDTLLDSDMLKFETQWFGKVFSILAGHWSFRNPVAWFPLSRFWVEPGHQNFSKLQRGFSGASKVDECCCRNLLKCPHTLSPGLGGEEWKACTVWHNSHVIFCNHQNLLPLGEHDLNLPASRNRLFLDWMNIHSMWFVLKVAFNAIFVQQM